MAGLGLFIHSLMGMIKDNKENKGSQKPVIVPYDEIITGQINNHNYVDLGLPSGLKWATCNVGANSPEEFGNYYAWGETQPKKNYDCASLKYSEDAPEPHYVKLTKYNTHIELGPVDGKIQLEPDDDVASVNWGNPWRTPSKHDFEELISVCTWEYSIFHKIKGVKITGPNGKSIFLPISGYKHFDSLDKECGHYWSSSLASDESKSTCSWQLFIRPKANGSSLGFLSRENRSLGLTIRAVSL